MITSTLNFSDGTFLDSITISIDSKTFSGMGVSFRTESGKEISFVKKPKKQDPTERLKKLAGMGVCKPKNKKQSGGLAPLAISLITSLVLHLENYLI